MISKYKMLTIIILLVFVFSVVMPMDLIYAENSMSQDATKIKLGEELTESFSDNVALKKYSIDIPTQGKLKVTVKSSIWGLGFALYMPDGKTKVLGSYYMYPKNNVPGSDIITQEYYLKPGTYYLIMSTNNKGIYTINTIFTQTGDDLEPNDSFDMANLLSLNAKNFTGLAALKDVQDWYKLVLPASGKIKINIKSSIWGLHTKLYASDGKSALSELIYMWPKSETPGSDMMTQEYWLNAGTYYLIVAADYAGTYNISTSFTLVGDDLEPNGSFEQANPISVNTTQFVGLAGLKDHLDYYRIELPVSGKLKIKLQSSIWGLSPNLYNGDKHRIGYTPDYLWPKKDVPGSDIIEKEYDLKAGTYYYVVSMSYPGTYTFSLSFPNTVTQTAYDVPVCTDLNNIYEIEKGGKLTLTSKVNANTDITQIIVGLDNISDCIAAVQPMSTSYDLGSLAINTEDLKLEPGEYPISIWAKTAGSLNSKTKLGTTVLKIKEKSVAVNSEKNSSYPGEKNSLYPGQKKPLSGVIDLPEGTTRIRVTATRIGDFKYIGELYNSNKVNGKKFDLKNVVFSATGENYSVPGDFTIKIAAMGKTGIIKTFETKVTVKDPIVYKEIRYLLEQDQIYLRADIDKTLMPKNGWPNVWVGVFDTVEDKWLYLLPDANNMMKHVDENKYELYFPCTKLHRNEKLRIMFLVDGYNVHDSIRKKDQDNITITPIPRYCWTVRYNWVTDEIEAVVTPDVINKSVKIPEIYINIYDDNNLKPLYVEYDINSEIPLYKGSDERYIGKYFRSWNLKQLHLDRDKTYRVAVVAKGFEKDLNTNFLVPLVVDKPAISFFNTTPMISGDKVNLRVKLQTRGVPANWKVRLHKEGSDLYLELPVSNCSSYLSLIDHNKEFTMNELGLVEGVSSTLIAEVLDENSTTVVCTAKRQVCITKPKPASEISSSFGDLYENYAKAYLTYAYNNNEMFDPDQAFGFEDKFQDAAIEWAQEPVMVYTNVYKEFVTYGTKSNLLKDRKEIFSDLMEAKMSSLYKDEIRKMIKNEIESAGFKKKIEECYEKNKDITKNILSVLGFAADKSYDIQKIRIDNLEKALKSSKLPDAQKYLNRLNITKKAFSGLNYGAMSVEFLPILMTSAQTNEDLMNSFLQVSILYKDELSFKDSSGNFVKAVDQVYNEFSTGSEKLNKTVELLAKDLKSILVDKTLEKVCVYAAAAKFGIDMGIEFSGINKLLEPLDRTIACAMVQNMAQEAFHYYARHKDYYGVRGCGTVYLLAAKQANLNFGDFIKGAIQLSNSKNPDPTFKKALDYSIERIKKIDAALPLWMNSARLK